MKKKKKVRTISRIPISLPSYSNSEPRFTMADGHFGIGNAMHGIPLDALFVLVYWVQKKQFLWRLSLF